jgi:PncC family amidohydrolase
MKIKLLGVPAEMLAEHTAVSEPVAIAMAEGARRNTESEWALSVTGYAGPDGDQVGLVFIGLAGPKGAEARGLQFPGDRERIRTLATNTALDLLRRRLLGL